MLLRKYELHLLRISWEQHKDSELIYASEMHSERKQNVCHFLNFSVDSLFLREEWHSLMAIISSIMKLNASYISSVPSSDTTSAHEFFKDFQVPRSYFL